MYPVYRSSAPAYLFAGFIIAVIISVAATVIIMNMTQRSDQLTTQVVDLQAQKSQLEQRVTTLLTDVQNLKQAKTDTDQRLQTCSTQLAVANKSQPPQTPNSNNAGAGTVGSAERPGVLAAVFPDLPVSWQAGSAMIVLFVTQAISLSLYYRHQMQQMGAAANNERERLMHDRQQVFHECMTRLDRERQNVRQLTIQLTELTAQRRDSYHRRQCRKDE